MMERMTYPVAELEEKHLISILMFLLDNGPSRKTDVYDGVSTNPRMNLKVQHLEAMGLINLEYNNALRSTVVTLTDAGRRIAEHLVVIESILRSVQ